MIKFLLVLCFLFITAKSCITDLVVFKNKPDVAIINFMFDVLFFLIIVLGIL